MHAPPLTLFVESKPTLQKMSAALGPDFLFIKRTEVLYHLYKNVKRLLAPVELFKGAKSRFETIFA
jgi:hypothetical protein